jgi:hypothetical protein
MFSEIVQSVSAPGETSLQGRLYCGQTRVQKTKDSEAAACGY